MAGLRSILCFTIIAAVFAHAIAADYCNMKTCKDKAKVHTLCKYTSPKPAPACVNGYDNKLTPAEKAAILKKHNDLRQRVASGQETKGITGPQPAATSMSILEWDNELEEIAQRWANQCEYGHDDCRDVDRFKCGQNVAETSSTGENKFTVTDMVQMWYDEVKDFDKNQVPKFTGQKNSKAVVGHYTQLIWADTTKIGCGRIKYQEGKWNHHYLVCNYGPAGNIINRPIYQIKK